MPAAISPAATAVTSSANSAAVTSVQPAAVLRRKATAAGDRAALSNTASAKFSDGSIPTVLGTVYSRTSAPRSRRATT
jgi:hypothetical protein